MGTIGDNFWRGTGTPPSPKLESIKLGNIVGETMFLVMFPGVARLGNMFRTQNLCPGRKNVFDSRQKHFLFSEQQNLFPQHMFPARLNWETFASATMFPQQCFLV